MKIEGLLFEALPYSANTMDIFSNLRNSEAGAFLLQSGQGSRDHTDVISVNPVKLETLGKDTGLESLASFIDTINVEIERHASSSSAPHPLPGWFGVLNYQLGSVTEKVPLKSNARSQRLPLAWVGFFPTIVVIDHHKKTSGVFGIKHYRNHFEDILSKLANKRPVQVDEFHLTTPFSSNVSQKQYGALFERIKGYIESGDCYQVNLAHRFSATYKGSPWSAYQTLRDNTNAPMTSFFETPQWSLLSMSPERFISCRKGKLVTNPIKGTRPRLENTAMDELQKQELKQSTKDRAENLMIVDLLRNDLGRSCQPGSIKVPSLFSVETFTYVHHLVSTIEGQLRDEVSPLQALLWAFPGGSITGAPKHRAMEIIDELEQECRGFYCGSAFYYDVAKNLDSSILIRSLVAVAGEVECWAGGGIVADSVMEQEYQETFHKVQGLLKALF